VKTEIKVLKCYQLLFSTTHYQVFVQVGKRIHKTVWAIDHQPTEQEIVNAIESDKANGKFKRNWLFVELA
jgi:hypothetical protein